MGGRGWQGVEYFNWLKFESAPSALSFTRSLFLCKSTVLLLLKALLTFRHPSLRSLQQSTCMLAQWSYTRNSSPVMFASMCQSQTAIAAIVCLFLIMHTPCVILINLVEIKCLDKTSQCLDKLDFVQTLFRDHCCYVHNYSDDSLGLFIILYCTRYCRTGFNCLDNTWKAWFCWQVSCVRTCVYVPDFLWLFPWYSKLWSKSANDSFFCTI